MEEFLNKITTLKEFLAGAPKRIAVVTHTNPDGDAIGSSLAWAEVLMGLGHEVSCLVPNRYPSFLGWMQGVESVIVAKENPEVAAEKVAAAELVFIMDLNKIDRLDTLTEAIEANTTAPRILIDHHLSPPNDFTLQFSYPDLCSTAYLTVSIAENIYAGIMTDTGNFAFSTLTSDLMRAVAVLLERGLNIPKVHTAVYDSYTADRVKLLGYSLCHKMKLLEEGRAAYLSLSEREMRQHNFQLGDSEGFVNYPLTIVGVKISAMFTETRKFIRVSLRSRGDEVDVNVFARKYFGGGGHKNAAGGKSFVSLRETIENYKKAVAEFLPTCNLKD